MGSSAVAKKKAAKTLVGELIIDGKDPKTDKASPLVWDFDALVDWYAGCERLSGLLKRLGKDDPIKAKLPGTDKNQIRDKTRHKQMLAALREVEEDLSSSDEEDEGTKSSDEKHKKRKASDDKEKELKDSDEDEDEE